MSKIEWKCLNSAGPSVAHHTGAVINEALYIHGGILKTGSTDPTNQLSRFDPTSNAWIDLTSDQSPHLSHHAGVVIGDYWILIGGWNGRARTSDVSVYDVINNRWIDTKTDGFPSGAGLSSHSAVLLTNGEVLVIGREGSLRTQRRSGNSFLLRCDPQKGIFHTLNPPPSPQKKFKYLQ